VAINKAFVVRNGISINTTPAIDSFGNWIGPWSLVTANTTLIPGQNIIANTLGGSFYVTLPATPSLGATITIKDGYAFSSNNLIINPNGSVLENQSGNLIIDISNAEVWLTYDGTQWQVSAGAGSNTTYTTSYVSSVTKSTNYNATTLDNVIFANGQITITLPVASSANNKVFTIKRISSAGPVTCNVMGGGLIDNNASLLITSQYNSITVASDGSYYWII
jgi:hypothetical protein